jgi:hypothetical protein
MFFFTPIILAKRFATLDVLSQNSNVPVLRPVPLISIGTSIMSFNGVTAILLLPGGAVIEACVERLTPEDV